MRTGTTIAVGALIITGLWLGLASESGDGDETVGPVPKAEPSPDAHLQGRGAAEQTPRVDGPGEGQTEPPLNELAAFLSETLASAPPKVQRDPTWLREKSEAIPGGMPTLVKWLFSGQDLSEEMESLVNGLGFKALAGAGQERIRVLRPMIVQAFEGMESPTLAAWRIGRDWMSYLRVKRGMFSSLPAVESLARTLAGSRPEHRAVILADAADLGCRSDLLLGDLVQIMQAALAAEEQGVEAPIDAERVFMPSMAILRENADGLPIEFVERLVASRMPEASYVGALLLLNRYPQTIDRVMEPVLRTPLEHPWYEYFLVNLVRQYGQEAVELLPKVFEEGRFDVRSMLPILAPEAAWLSETQLAQAILDGRASWDPGERKIMVRR